jgi:hypothetical protein
VLTEDRRRESLELLAAAALWIEPSERVEDCRDPKDNCYLALALAAGASVILSGDEYCSSLTPGVVCACCGRLSSFSTSGPIDRVVGDLPPVRLPGAAIGA